MVLNHHCFADVSENSLTRIEGLDVLPNLSNLNISKNLLSTAIGIENLVGCKKLSSVDFSHNNLETEDVIGILSKITTLLSINMTGNPIASKVSHFRKKTIVSIKSLRYLDRPIFDVERESAEAWSIGGREAELRVKKDWQKKKQQEEAKSCRDFRQWQEGVRAQALDEKRHIELNGPTEDQIMKEEERVQRIQERKAKAAEAAKKEREIYRIDVSDQGLRGIRAISGTIDNAVGSDCVELPLECNSNKAVETAIVQPKDVPLPEICSPCPKSSMHWSEKMDVMLKTFALELDFDFDLVSIEISKSFQGNQISAEDCRLRWCLLESAKTQSNEQGEKACKTK